MSAHGRLKRVIDIVAALALFPPAIVLCVCLAVLIRVETRGSPLFLQRRVGRGRQIFWILKLRTMHIDTADRPSHETQRASITRVGAVVRKLKLDELPQLWNVIAGSMSFVGPRPCLPTQLELIDARAELGLFQFPPGITGPAQLAGVDMSDPQRLVQIEEDYFRRATLRSDFAMLLKTAVGSGRGDPAMRADVRGISQDGH